MRKKLLSGFFLLFIGISAAFAQAPQAINYQAVARDATGNLMASSTVGIKVNILDGSPTGAVLYSEEHTVTTNVFGLFTLQVGRGMVVTGSFTTIDWSAGNQWMQIELDPTGSGFYYLMGTSELLTVPYAFYAEEVGSINLSMNDLMDADTSGVVVGSVLKWNGFAWVPAPDDNTPIVYYGGTGITISGDTIYHTPHWGDAIGADSLTVTGLQGRPVTMVPPADGNILKFNALTGGWELAVDSSSHPHYGGTGITVSGDTIYHTPHWGDAVGADSLTVTGIQGNPVVGGTPSDGDILKFNSSTGMWELSSDSSGTLYTAGNGIAITGDTIHNTIWSDSGSYIYKTDTGNVGIGTSLPDPTAILDLTSTTQGFLMPRLSEAERDSITAPAFGLTIFNTTDSVIQYFNGDCWLKVYQRDCDACEFSIAVSDSFGVIDHITSDTTGTDIIINQTFGSPTSIGLVVYSGLPAGMTATLSSSTVFSSGTVRLTVEASIFSTPGTYPIVVQAFCGTELRNVIFEVTVDSCYIVDITTNQTDFDLASFGSLPGPGTPICVIATVYPGVEITGTVTTGPAFTNGSLDPSSHVAIRNMGLIIGHGGDGGAGGSFTTYGAPGEDGGDALDMTCKTSLDNTAGSIYGGGAGGGSVGIELVSLPFVGTISIGAGGGGGAGEGLGGTAGALSLFLWEDGADGTGGAIGAAGAGGLLSVPISIPISGVTVTVTPNGYGGDGGEYGFDGGIGNLFVNVKVAVPFVGTIFDMDFPDPPISSFPAGGIGGLAVKRNGYILSGYLDGMYNTIRMKGKINP